MYSSQGKTIQLETFLTMNMSSFCMRWLGLIVLSVYQSSMVDNLFRTSSVSNHKSCNVTTAGNISGYKVNCSGLGLVPSCIEIGLSVNCSLVTQLILANNQIKQIPNMAFHDFPNLLHLDLSNNPIGKCENGSFRGLPELQGLRMTNIIPDVFLVFESDTFRPLKSLEWMDMSYSLIHKQSFFTALCSVVSDLHSLTLNGLKDIQGTVLVDLTEEITRCFNEIRLQNLSMEGSLINRMSFKSMLNFVKVNKLSFRKNELIMVYSKLFVGMAAVHNLTYFDGSCQNSQECEDTFPWSEWLPNKPVMYQHSNSTMVETNELLNTNKNVIDLYFLPNLQTLKLHHLSNVISQPTYVPSVCWKNC